MIPQDDPEWIRDEVRRLGLHGLKCYHTFVDCEPTWEGTGWQRIVGPFEASLPPGEEARRKHPVIAGGADGRTLIAGTEGTGWKRGGSLGWQIFDSEGRPIGQQGKKPGAIPVWGSTSVAARPAGGFLLVY